MRTRAVVAALASAVVLTACADSRGISDAAARSLQAQVADVRAAVAAQSRVRTDAELRELRQLVADVVERGELTETRAAEILAAATAVEQQLGLLPPAPSPTPTPTPTEEDRKGRGKEKDEENKDDD